MHEDQRPQTEAFGLSAAECEAIEHKMHHCEDPCAASIETLKIVWKQRGQVPDGVIHAITGVLDTPTGDVGGMAMFYSQILRQPVGRRVIRYCDNAVCHINGCQDIQAALERKLNIKPGQTTFDGRSTLLPICCLGNCDRGSNIMIDEDTRARLTPEAIPELLGRYK